MYAPIENMNVVEHKTYYVLTVLESKGKYTLKSIGRCIYSLVLLWANESSDPTGNKVVMAKATFSKLEHQSTWLHEACVSTTWALILKTEIPVCPAESVTTHGYALWDCNTVSKKHIKM